MRFDLCLGPLREASAARATSRTTRRSASGHAVAGESAGWRRREHALAVEFAAALDRLRRERPELGLGRDGKILVAVESAR